MSYNKLVFYVAAGCTRMFPRYGSAKLSNAELGTKGSRLTAVGIEDLRIEEQAARACEEEDARGHVRVVARTARWIGHAHVKLGLLVFARRTGRHFAGEDARRDAVDADLRFGESGGHHSR